MSNKPTIFFSHSSKDKVFLLNLKNRLTEITNGTLDIFMSSDGQSIPFGRNWLNSIEQGLNDAKIMFIFVTPNSLLSNWIYFEAGFAYSKNIEVIPVGIGVDIGLLKPPLSLLQGFNINSSDSLNNLIPILNKKFDYSFKKEFVDEDYTALINSENSTDSRLDMSDIFVNFYYEISSEYSDGNGGKIQYDLEKLFDNILGYMNEKHIQYSLDDKSRSLGDYSKCILALGMKIAYKIYPKESQSNIRQQHESDKISFSISPYNFKASFSLFCGFMIQFDEKETVWLHIRLNHRYAFVTEIEKQASIISQHPETFEFQKDSIGSFKYVLKDIKFSIFDNTGRESRKERDYVLGFAFRPCQTLSDDIYEFINSLLDKGIIYQIDRGGSDK